MNLSINTSSNRYFSNIDRVINHYSIEKTFFQLSQIDFSKSNIFADVISSEGVEALHIQKEFKVNFESTLLSNKDASFKTIGRIEKQTKLNANISNDQYESKSLVPLNQYHAMKDDRPERFITNSSNVISNTSTKLSMQKNSYLFAESNYLQATNHLDGIKSSLQVSASNHSVNLFADQLSIGESVQVSRPEKTISSKLQNQERSISLLKESSFVFSESKVVIPQRLSEINKRSILSRHNNPSSNSEKRPEKLTSSSQSQPSKELNRQKLIDDVVNRPISYKEPLNAYRDFDRISKELRGVDQQHITAAEAFARRYGPNLTRAFGFGNETAGLIGDLFKSFFDINSSGDVFERLMERKVLQGSTSFEFKDLIDNEIGIGLAGYTDYSREILEIVKANPNFYRLYSKEIASNPFKHYAVENRERFELGISKPTGRPSDRYSLGIASPVSTSTSRYNLRASALPPQPTYKTSAQGSTNPSEREGSNRGDGRDRSQGAGGRDAGQRERNRESGHKGYGGPQ